MRTHYPKTLEQYRKQLAVACAKFDEPVMQAEGFRELAELRVFEKSIKSRSSVSLLRHSESAPSLEQALHTAPDDGSGEMQYLQGWAKFHGIGTKADKDAAVHLWDAAAMKGYAPAQARLGEYLLDGEGMPRNERAAVTLLTSAAEKGHVRAESLLGDYYFSQNEMPMAMEWLRKAATHGDAKAQTTLGACHFSGEAMPKDLVKSVKLLVKASVQGDLDAKKMLPLMIGQRNKDRDRVTDAVLDAMGADGEKAEFIGRMLDLHQKFNYIDPLDKPTMMAVTGALKYCQKEGVLDKAHHGEIFAQLRKAKPLAPIMEEPAAEVVEKSWAKNVGRKAGTDHKDPVKMAAKKSVSFTDEVTRERSQTPPGGKSFDR